jgi:hypothetical protein
VLESLVFSNKVGREMVDAINTLSKQLTLKIGSLPENDQSYGSYGTPFLIHGTIRSIAEVMLLFLALNFCC